MGGRNCLNCEPPNQRPTAGIEKRWVVLQRFFGSTFCPVTFCFRSIEIQKKNILWDCCSPLAGRSRPR